MVRTLSITRVTTDLASTALAVRLALCGRACTRAGSRRARAWSVDDTVGVSELRAWESKWSYKVKAERRVRVSKQVLGV